MGFTQPNGHPMWNENLNPKLTSNSSVLKVKPTPLRSVGSPACFCSIQQRQATNTWSTTPNTQGFWRCHRKTLEVSGSTNKPRKRILKKLEDKFLTLKIFHTDDTMLPTSLDRISVPKQSEGTEVVCCFCSVWETRVLSSKWFWCVDSTMGRIATLVHNYLGICHQANTITSWDLGGKRSCVIFSRREIWQLVVLAVNTINGCGSVLI